MSPDDRRPTESSRRVYARVAGAGYLVVIGIAVLNAVLVDARLIVAGDDGATARNILAHEPLFRIGIVGMLIMYAAVLVLSGALYIVLETVNRPLALLALLLRAAEAVVGAFTVVFSFAVVALLNGDGRTASLDVLQRQTLASLVLDVRTAGLDPVLMLVGLGGMLFSYLFFVSRFVPRVLSAWGIATYASMLALGIVSIVAPGHSVVVEIVLYSFGTAFEVVFGGWLAFKGVHVAAASSVGGASEPARAR